VTEGRAGSTDPRSQFYLATEEGDLVFADWQAKASGPRADDEEEHSESRELVRWITRDNSRPCCSLEMSPFLPDLLLSLSDWSFNLWWAGRHAPVFTSPIASSIYTCGVWSPTRPAVLVAACADGSLQIWDFTDSSYRPSVELKAAHTRVTSMEFLRPSGMTPPRQQLLAIGDQSGTLHVFEIPRALIRPAHNERQLMVSLIDREMKVLVSLHVCPI
jgi:WD40 repeat protein